ncbi:precorrin-2 C(20)-methyltransferase [Spirillospora sp. NPDC047279]|uniref:precorrin-2 C(20)-methyltransferase n=1 Tax=Spirillospora sp. NPDC047279 TaxID=3155478 RepID=UPI0033DDCFB6
MSDDTFRGPVHLRGERVELRPFSIDDGAALIEVIRAGEDFLPDNFPAELDAEKLAWWLTTGVHQPHRYGLAVHLAVVERDSGAFVGTIGLFRVDWSQGTCEVGYGMRPGLRRRGHATEALRLVSAWALRDCGLHRVELRAVTSNFASLRVAEKAGFVREGTARGGERDAEGVNRDQHVFSLLAADLDRAEGEGAGDRPPVLVGIGVGPGDPELVTAKAVRLLRAADVVLVPVMALDEEGRAESVVRAHTGKAERVVFALNDRGGVTAERAAAWDGAADRVVRAFAEGARTVVFATIGDPNVYSTFTYLAQTVRERRPGAVVETVPGITAMQDLAARSGTVLTEGAESLTLVPVTRGTARLGAALEHGDTVVAYKFGAVAEEVVEVLKDAGRLDEAVYGERLGLDGEDVRPAREITGPVPYLSTLIVPGHRTTRGGKL